uniref:Perilipin n=1 Tax=Petromyzon marinus TaxID=7757 RepID=A0AAJ7SQ42_PETMA|nr:perilipin-2-like [Petromyzon marinus]XP_032802755.1 perilipin-2-like [Petromyzon marinus]
MADVAEIVADVGVEQPAAQESIMSRVANLPLLSSAYDMMASAYSSTKENHPYVKSVCEVAEQGVRTVAGVAATTVKPLVDKLEPQISTANQYACLGLDKLEQKLPILQQPTEQVASSARGMVGATVGTVTSSVTGVVDKTKGVVTSGVEMTKGVVSGGVEMTKGVVNSSVEMTKGVVSGGVSTVMNSRVGQLVTAGVDSALGKTDEYVDYYLPPSELDGAQPEQSGEAVGAVAEGQLVAGQEPQSYYVQLSCLSTKVRQRLYEQSVTRLRNAKLRSQDAIAQLQHTVNLIEYAKTHLDSSSQLVQEKLQSSWQQWQKTQPAGGADGAGAEEPQSDESRTLAMARALSQQVHTSCVSLASNVRGLPQNVQDQAQRVRQNAEALVAAFRNTTSFKDIPEQLLTRSKEQMAQVSSSLDGVLEYVAENIPGGWVVGPLRRVEKVSTESTGETGGTADVVEAVDAPVQEDKIPK